MAGKSFTREKSWQYVDRFWPASTKTIWSTILNLTSILPRPLANGPGARRGTIHYLYQGLIPKTNKLNQRKYKQFDPTSRPTVIHAQVCSRNTCLCGSAVAVPSISHKHSLKRLAAVLSDPTFRHCIFLLPNHQLMDFFAYNHRAIYINEIKSQLNYVVSYIRPEPLTIYTRVSHKMRRFTYKYFSLMFSSNSKLSHCCRWTLCF